MPATRHDAVVPEAGAAAVSCYLCPSCHRGPLEIGQDTAAALVPATCAECGAPTGLRHDETAVGPTRIAYHQHRVQHPRYREVDLWGRIQPLPSTGNGRQAPTGTPDPSQLSLL